MELAAFAAVGAGQRNDEEEENETEEDNELEDSDSEIEEVVGDD